MTSNAARRTLAAYAAGIAVIAALMAVVALGGNTVTMKRPAMDFSSSQATALNEQTPRR